MRYLILLLLPFTLFSMTIEDIDIRVAEIELRLPEIPPLIVPIQEEIDIKQAELDTINGDLLVITGEIENKESQIADKQIEIGIKVEERDALEEEDPARVLIQDEINILIGERDVLTEDLAPLLAQEQLKMDEVIVKSDELNIELNKKKSLTNEQTYLTNEKARLLDNKRRILWQARFDALPSLRLAMYKLGINESNPALMVIDIIESNDEARLIALEGVTAQVQADLDAELARDQKLEEAKAEIRAIDPLTIKTSDTIKLLKEITIVLQEMLVR